MNNQNCTVTRRSVITKSYMYRIYCSHDFGIKIFLVTYTIEISISEFVANSNT